MAAAVAIAPKAPKVVLPGEGLGFPLYHAVTGNLPVLSVKFHTPHHGTGGAGPSAYAYASGNLPVISRELMAEEDDDLMPGWITLIDPVTRHSFWWNSYYRSRREARPCRSDDGRVGAGRGELEGKLLSAAYVRRHGGEDDADAAPRCVAPNKTWQQLWDPARMHVYNWNRRTNETRWDLPAGGEGDCLMYESLWRIEYDAGTSTASYVCKAMGETSSQIPAGFDNRTM